MDALLHDAAGRAIGYLSALHDRPVAPAPEALAALRVLDTPLPEAPTDPAVVLRILDETASPATTAMAGPRFFGFVVGGSLPAALAANWLAGAWDQNTGLYQATPGTSGLEKVALRWLLETLHLPPECGAELAGGGMGPEDGLQIRRAGDRDPGRGIPGLAGRRVRVAGRNRGRLHDRSDGRQPDCACLRAAPGAVAGGMGCRG